MITLRKSHERGHADYGWLNTFHSFSFADYYEPAHMGVSHLRVINDDRIAAGSGFPTHPHRDMEIITYILAGALAHKDSMGNTSVIRAGEVQRMSAGTGITHSEYNPSAEEQTHLLQIWILPKTAGLTPGYEQKQFDAEAKRGRLCLIASPDRRNGSVRIHQDALLYAALLDSDESVSYALAENRLAYVHVAKGQVQLNGKLLTAGDGATVRDESVRLESGHHGEVLLFDLVKQQSH